MDKLYLVETHQVKPSNKDYNELDYLCFLSKNLYNSTMFVVRQEYFKSQTYLDYYRVNKFFVDNDQVDYRALPAKVAKQSQLLVHQAFVSFFRLLKLKQAGKYGKLVSQNICLRMVA